MLLGPPRPWLAIAEPSTKLKTLFACMLVTLPLALPAKTVFGTRLSLLAHLSDVRRPKCRDYVLSHSSTIDAELCTELDMKDAKLRLLAQRNGYSHSLVTIPAKKARISTRAT